ncbi:hypothetical protein ABTZ58_23940 [Streptomyces sp. NPDC094143]|uniref:hypothetical protein n=1 Tax=Streptomyces sp. NPDC094143 TaxID=3155310 RepID=UPI0033235C5D
MPDTGVQQSNVRDLQAAVNALNMADEGVTRIRADVDATRHDLASHYTGSDGERFGGLVEKWQGQAQRIQDAVRALRSQLEEGIRQKQQEQGANVDAISERSARSDAVFDEMIGGR